jgi:hypothetical protein
MEMHPIPIGGGHTLGESKNWRIREATAADVVAGDAVVEGSLIIEHKTNGTKDEIEA